MSTQIKNCSNLFIERLIKKPLFLIILSLYLGCDTSETAGEIINLENKCPKLKNTSSSKIYSFSIAHFDSRGKNQESVRVTLKPGEIVWLRECWDKSIIQGAIEINPINYEQHKSWDHYPYNIKETTVQGEDRIDDARSTRRRHRKEDSQAFLKDIYDRSSFSEKGITLERFKRDINDPEVQKTIYDNYFQGFDEGLTFDQFLLEIGVK